MAAHDRDSGDPSLTTIERLILAQAVYEHGADAWESVSNVLSNHPALARQKDFSPQFCHQIYHRLMNEASLECSEANSTPHAPVNLKLAQRHYSARLLHLRDLIATEEARFKALVTEIDEIRSGAWDDKIKAKLIGNDNTNSIDVPAGPQSPLEITSEPQQSATNEPSTASDQAIITQTPDDDTPTIDDDTQQLPTTVTPEPPVDSQIVKVIPVTENAALEPASADIIEAFEGLTTGDNVLEKSEPVVENVGMEVDASSAPPEPEYVANGQAQQREAKRKISDSDNLDDGVREKKRPRDESTSPDILAQQTPPAVPNKRFQTVIGMLHSQISQHRNGNIFHNPIKNSEAPDYHDIIKRPMDLKTIKARVKDGIISNSLEFQRDVYLMFANAMMYNRPGSDIFHMAEEMMLESEVHINTFRQTEGFIRSTRS